jgi:hypothetical protein
MEPVSGKIDIEPILELSADATIVHTTRWQVKFAAFLERLSANQLLGRVI